MEPIKCKSISIKTDDAGHVELSLKVDRESWFAARRAVREISLKGKDIALSLGDWRNKRSRDANAYFWVLCGKLAATLGIAKEEIYRSLIVDIGDNFEITSIPNAGIERWIKGWRNRGLGWVCEIIGPSDEAGQTSIINYFGSSTYDTAQMSRLIELVVQECQQQGIETKPEDEIQSLLDSWEAA